VTGEEQLDWNQWPIPDRWPVMQHRERYQDRQGRWHYLDEPKQMPPVPIPLPQDLIDKVKAIIDRHHQ